MTFRHFAFALLCLTAVLVSIPAERARAADNATLELGSYVLKAPAGWTRKQPRSQIIAYEFAIPKAEGDEQDGRLTIMAAGGSIDENIQRWVSQFTPPPGKSPKDLAKVEQEKAAGQTIHLVDISGTYDDKPGPVAPGVKRENYRMLGAIIATDEANYFVKFYGPRNTVEAAREDFRRMVLGLEHK